LRGGVRQITRVDPEGAIDILLSSKGLTINPFQWLWVGTREGLEEKVVSTGLGGHISSVPETTTPAAEKYARSLGMYGSVILTKKIVRDTIPLMKALYVDLKADPDEGGFPTICFAITFRESVDRAVELDDALQDTLFDQIPTDHRVHLSFAYHLE